MYYQQILSFLHSNTPKFTLKFPHVTHLTISWHKKNIRIFGKTKMPSCQSYYENHNLQDTPIFQLSMWKIHLNPFLNRWGVRTQIVGIVPHLAPRSGAEPWMEPWLLNFMMAAWWVWHGGYMAQSFFYITILMGVSIVMGVPENRCFLLKSHNLKWMRNGGTPMT